uniref:Membrane-fusion protein-like protein n=1 Tax=Marinomonas sp. (strain MWYL1) TaxID=400668 RepID=A6VS10_MARMS
MIMTLVAWCRAKSFACLLGLGGVFALPSSFANEVYTESGMADNHAIRVQLKAQDKMVLSSQLSGRIETLVWKEGQSFKKGQQLVAFDCGIYKAKLDYAIAAETTAQKKHAIAQRLDNLQSISVLDVSQAESDFIMAEVERKIGEVMVKRCAIAAPFSGRVSKRLVEQGEFVSEGEPLLEIYNTSAYEVELIAPSRWISRVNIGDTFTVQLDETNQEYEARVTRLGSVIDPLSQSFSVFGQIFSKSKALLLPGMSGSALFSYSTVSEGNTAQ